MLPNAFADDVQEKAVLIQTSNKAESLIRGREKDFEIVEDTDEVSGDPVGGTKESYASWKEACKEWKKEIKEANPGQVVTINCGSAKMEKDDTSGKGAGIYVYKSTGKYRLKVRIRDQAK